MEDMEQDLRSQRDLAVVCAVLSAALSVSILWNGFGRDFPGLERTRQAAELHRALLVQNQKALQEVSAAIPPLESEIRRLSEAK
jgi:hypothetical protein